MRSIGRYNNGAKNLTTAIVHSLLELNLQQGVVFSRFNNNYTSFGKQPVLARRNTLFYHEFFSTSI